MSNVFMFSAQGSDLFIAVVYLTMLPVTQILYFCQMTRR